MSSTCDTLQKDNAAMSTTGAACSPCAQMGSQVRDSIIRIDARLRRSSLILAIYGVIMVSLVGIIAYILNNCVQLILQWRYMSRMSRPASSIVSTSTFASVGDDEVYKADTDNPAAAMPSVGSLINVGMNELQNKYSAYNKQIQDYSTNILKMKTPADVFDRRVLNRVNDDFK